MISKATPAVAGLALVAGVAIGWVADSRWGRAAGQSANGTTSSAVARDKPASRLADVTASSAATQPAASDDGLSVYFSPNGGCTAAILR